MNIIIFGASGSIGSFLTKEYISRRNKVLIFTKNYKSKKKLQESLNLKKVTIDQLNLENFSSINRKLNQYKFFIKRTNIIINASGDLGEIKSVLNINLKKFKKTLNVNFVSNLVLLQGLSKYIKKNKNLLIIFFSGGGVTSYRQNFSSYSISKLSLVKLVEIASNEIDNRNVRINAIAPGIIKSRMIDTTIKNKKLVSKKEINKIKKDLNSSQITLKKLFNVINFLSSTKGKNITGKLISSKWDNIENWDKNKIEKLIKSDLYSMKRVQ